MYGLLRSIQYRDIQHPAVQHDSIQYFRREDKPAAKPQGTRPTVTKSSNSGLGSVSVGSEVATSDPAYQTAHKDCISLATKAEGTVEKAAEKYRACMEEKCFVEKNGKWYHKQA
ncbi:hypothetical protein C8J56DRAFT_879942 [Mycena floridula]|nr:hypothetical protein C8J56DRAFT_879942 [Mycena floridula]